MPESGGLPSGTVTFLFTDLEGSTRLWEEHPDAMHDALARHDELVRSAIESHHGHVVKTTGDGFHAAFSTARDAVLAAVSAQVALDGEAWSDTGPLRVRMGLHTGEARHRGGDYFGPELNRAARIMSAGHGGQVLLSHATEELVRDALADGCELVSLGEHQLRDLGRPEVLFQLTHADLQRDFGRVRSLDAYPGNLPLQVTSFVGRAGDMESVISALEEARLVTLTGVGGVGKTRLALQVAGELLPKFPDGSWLVELATAGDADALVQVVATVVGATSHPTVSLESRVLHRLRDQHLLLVLDNCEHLLDSASRMASAILRECGAVRLLATSREPLDVDGEHVARVRSLPLPESADGSTTEDSDAVRLFLERARSAEPDLALDKEAVGTVTEICRRLDGIPLAIELAAARVVSMSPGEILALLDERFRLLTGGRRTSVERHQTLRATVDWSYSLLQPTERTVFDRLGVFPGSFDAAAAQAITQGDEVEDWDVRDALTGLVNKSMVNTLAATAGNRRYQLLETMRQYARERLDQSGDADRYRRAHAQYYADLAGAIGVAMVTGRDLERARTTSEAEIDNFRAAVTWALDSTTSGDADLALRIAVRQAGNEPALRRAAGVIAQSDRLYEKARSSTPELHAGVLAGMANDALMLRGNVEEAADLAQRAIDLRPPAGAGLAMAHATGSLCAMSLGEYDRAVDILSAGILADAERGGGSPHSEAFFVMLLVRAELGRHNGPAALRYAEEAVRLSREAQFPLRLAQSLNTLATVLSDDDLDAARRAADEAAAVAQNVGLTLSFGNARISQAELAARAGDIRDALGLTMDAVEAWGDDVPLMTVVGAAARSCCIFAAAGDVTNAIALGTAAQNGRYSHLFRTIDEFLDRRLQRALEDLREQADPTAFDGAAARGTDLSSEEILRLMRDTAVELLGVLSR